MLKNRKNIEEKEVLEESDNSQNMKSNDYFKKLLSK
jgi:hypothetical protein